MNGNTGPKDGVTFWHSKMSLYSGYEQGDIVEVVHEPNKYWLATVEYSFKSLVLLKWLGDYGDFWIDASLQNDPSNNPVRQLSDGKTYYRPKRIFRLGHHKKCVSRCQFILEQPSKVLEKPSMYNPANDPYANVQNLDDLLALNMNKIKSSLETSARLLENKRHDDEEEHIVIAKTKIDYGQEDADELEAALQNLNDIDSGVVVQNQQQQQPEPRSSLPVRESEGATSNESQLPRDEDHYKTMTSDNIKDENLVVESKEVDSTLITTDQLLQSATDTDSSSSFPIPEVSSASNQNESTTDTVKSQYDSGMSSSPPTSTETPKDNLAPSLSSIDNQRFKQGSAEGQNTNENLRIICENLQTSASLTGKYSGLGKYMKQELEVKPKQIFDLGGLNHERLVVPGTILEVAHVMRDNVGPESKVEGNDLWTAHWYAIVLKNTSGLLTLRWFLCDDPKFKQGRLEMKSIKSELIQEQASELELASAKSNNNNLTANDGSNISLKKEVKSPEEMSTIDESGCGDKLNAELLTFTMHFCNPCIQTFNQYANYNPARKLKLPYKMSNFLEAQLGAEGTAQFESQQVHFIQTLRRVDLDRDRPLIDHLTLKSREKMPKIIEIESRQDQSQAKSFTPVLVACRNLTKVVKGKIVEATIDSSVELLIHTEPIEDTNEIVKFIYPYDTSYTILPVEWATTHEDCLSYQPSSNPTPDITNLATQEESLPKVDISPEVSQKSEISSQECQPTQETCPQLESSKESSMTIEISLNRRHEDEFSSQFKLMQQVEVAHPDSNSKICLGRIRKMVYPLLWIQISEFTYTLLPFNSTYIYPSGWCAANGYSLSNLLPHRIRKRTKNSSDINGKNNRNKRVKISHEDSRQLINPNDKQQTLLSDDNDYEIEELDLGSTSLRALHSDFLSDEDVVQIYFNHKCFTGPTLSKSKICSLPRYVGPGRFKLVMEEVMTKIISVAYVPPRVLNDLSSNSFKELLLARNLTNTSEMEFKAKYQKRVHRECVPVCLNPNDVLRYCECVCEHLKCCYNLIGPNSYDGDDCPGHCRALTKSNKFMKRAAYYREKARNGEYTNENSTSNNTDNPASSKSKSSNKSNSRARYAGRDSSSSNSSMSRSEAANGAINLTTTNRTDNNGSANATGSRPSSTGINDAKENLTALQEAIKEEQVQQQQREISALHEETNQRVSATDEPNATERKLPVNLRAKTIPLEFNIVGLPEGWTVEEVAEHLKLNGLGRFNPQMVAEGVDGQALVLLDRAIIREQFQQTNHPKVKYTSDELGRLYRFVEYVKNRSEATRL